MDNDIKKLDKAIEKFVDNEIKTKTLPLFKKMGIKKVPPYYKQKRMDSVREQMFESEKWVRDIMRHRKSLTK